MAFLAITAMNRTERTEYIRQLNEIKARLCSLEEAWKGRAVTVSHVARRNMLEDIRKLKVATLVVKSRIATTLPLTIEGYVGEDEEQVDQNEHGIVNEIYHYLGCPSFPNGRTVQYDEFRDITEILKHNTGKFLRITIEQIPKGGGEDCGTCENRFQCLTTKVREW